MPKWINAAIELSRVPFAHGIVYGLLVFLYAILADTDHHSLASIASVAASGFYITAPSPRSQQTHRG